VRTRALRHDTCIEQQFSGQPVRSVSFHYIERLVNGAADDRVEKLERILPAEEVKANERGGGRTELVCFDSCEGGRTT
jgi:hypothetical protein